MECLGPKDLEIVLTHFIRGGDAMEIRKVRRQTTGSYILTIPAEYIQQIGCLVGDWVKIELINGKILISKLEVREK